MKKLLKVATFTLISLNYSQLVLNSLKLDNPTPKSFGIVLVSLFVLNLLVDPVLIITTISTKGLKALVLHTILTAGVIYALTAFLANFSVNSIRTQDLLIFKDMLPSVSLPGLLSIGITALFLCVIFRFLSWLGAKK